MDEREDSPSIENVPRDLTERYAQQSRLFSRVLSSITDFAYTFDLGGRFTFVNKPLLDLWGLPLEQAIGKNFFDLKYPDELAAKLQRQITEVIQTRDRVVDETPYTSPSGAKGYYQYIFAPVLGTDGTVEAVAGSTRDITVHKRREIRDQFLVALDDAIRPLTDPGEITLMAARLLGTHLDTDRCAYADIEADQDTMNLTGNHTRTPEIRSIVGRMKFADFGAEVLQLMRDDLPFVVDDVDTHQPPITDRAAYRAAQIQAVICVPLHKGGRFVAAMAVHESRPRHWRPDEVDLVRQVAARCWESIERARVERTLREQAEFQRYSAEAGRTGAWYVNLDTRQCTISTMMAELMGFPAGQTLVPQEQWIERVVPDDRDLINAAMEASVRDNVPFDLEFRIAHPDRGERWLYSHGGVVRDGSGKALRLHGASVDVTERKRAEERDRRSAAEAMAAAEANAKFRTFFDQGTYFAGVMSLDGTVIECNRLALDASGFKREDVIGKKFWDCGWWNRSRDLMDMVRAGSMQAAAGQAFRKETNYFIADGSERFVQLVLAPVTDSDGRVLFVAPTGTDITDQKRMADERERLLDAERAARAEAERLGRMKDEFLATLSHELRTPLNAILGWAQILSGSDVGKNAEDVAEGLRTIERNARAQTQIIEDLLDMSRIVSGKVRLTVQRLELASVVRGAVETIKPAADAKGIRLHQVLDSSAAGVISGDSNRLQQVFWNLLSNAVKFTPRNGHVKVLLERVNSHLEVSVTDTGEGINPEFLPYVFDRFRQADSTTTRRHGGLGLGLAIVKQLTELHGGSARVKSAGQGHGTTFTVALPLTVIHSDSEPQSDRRHPAGEPDELIPQRADACAAIAGVKVLVVDDEFDARELLRRFLEDCDAVVVTADVADDAIAKVQSFAPDVLVSDIGMPREDGYSLIRRIRKLPPERGGNVPAIALTAYARLEDRVRSIAAGFQMHVAKPVEAAELITMVASLAGRTGRAEANSQELR